MRFQRFRRSVAAVALVALGAVVAASCTIPTEDQPQPINREQTTTTSVETP